MVTFIISNGLWINFFGDFENAGEIAFWLGYHVGRIIRKLAFKRITRIFIYIGPLLPFIKVIPFIKLMKLGKPIILLGSKPFVKFLLKIAKKYKINKEDKNLLYKNFIDNLNIITNP